MDDDSLEDDDTDWLEDSLEIPKNSTSILLLAND